MNYKTYAEAKIANPDCEIVTTGKDWAFEKSLKGVFQALGGSDGLRHSIGDDAWVICNPADHCSTLKEFLDAGLKLGDGDKFIGVGGYIVIVKKASAVNVPDDEDVNRYILSAESLDGGCKIEFIEHKSEPWTIYNNTMPLSELSDGQAAMLFNAWRGGAVLEKIVGAGWYESSNYELLTNTICRIKPKSEREMFIDKSVGLMTSETERTMGQMFGAQFDAGARYKDLTHHFGENI